MAYKKMSAYDKINKRFAKLSGGQSLEDRAKYWQKEKEFILANGGVRGDFCELFYT